VNFEKKGFGNETLEVNSEILDEGIHCGLV